jgi:tetratricopeptide (TPR) repeat protein
MKLHLFGDSVFRGEKTDIWQDPAPSLRVLQSPAAVINLVVGRSFAAMAGPTGFPEIVEEAADRLSAALGSGQIAPGDALAFLDVGPHSMDTARHEADWLRLRRAATAEHDVRLVMCSGFDNGARGLRDHQHEALLDGRSPNDAVRSAALAPGRFTGTTRFLDVATPLKDLHATLSPRFGLSPYFHDRVHLTAWGQIFLALLILGALDIRPAAIDRLADAVGANARRLGVTSREEALGVLDVTVRMAGVKSGALADALAQARLLGAARRALRGLAGGTRSDAAAATPEARDLISRGEQLAASGSLDEALEQFRRAAAMDVHSIDAHRGWVESAARAGRTQETIEAARAALALAPSSGKYYVWIAAAMLAERSGPDLVGWLDALAEAHAPPSAFPALADLNAALGDPERARVWTDRVEAKWRRQAV